MFQHCFVYMVTYNIYRREGKVSKVVPRDRIL